MAWELISAEQTDDYYEIKLSFRPAGRFRGKPGIEQFIIDKTGKIEVRQMLDEPTGLDLEESSRPIVTPPEPEPDPEAHDDPPVSQDAEIPAVELRAETPVSTSSYQSDLEADEESVSRFGKKKTLAGVAVYAALLTSGIMVYRWFLGDELSYFFGFDISDWIIHWLALLVGLGVAFFVSGFFRSRKR